MPTRLARLIGRMTLAEKLGQVTMIALGGPPTGPVADEPTIEAIRRGEAGSILNLVGRARIDEARRIAREETRLGIPLLFGLDIVHGCRTTFPVPIGEAATFDPVLWRDTARVAAAEAVAEGIDLTFAPMLDVCRDPRWGRIVEGPGEDPFVAAAFARAKVEGFQGAVLGPGSLAATAKHFCAYGAVAAGRDYAPVEVAERILEEVFLPPFRAAVEAGAAAIMPAFVDIAGVPMTAHVPLLRDRLRRRWGFDGVIVSDWGAIGELIHHGVAADEAEAAALALAAGLDIDMMSGAFARGLPAALGRGLVDEALLDRAVGRVLLLKERLGLFEAEAARPVAVTVPGEARALARTAAVRSTVLLENRGDVLPLGRPAALALIGPFAASGLDAIGPWAAIGEPDDAVTLADALGRALPATRIETVAGVDANGAEVAGIEAAVAAARRADIVVLCVGEPAALAGEAASRAEPGLAGEQEALARAVLAVGRPTVLILTCGRPLIVPWLLEAADAVLVGWFPGSEAGPALADILTGAAEPGGRLPMTWPRHLGQVPIHFGMRPGGRPYEAGNPFTSRWIDCPVGPHYPFGAGRGYASVRLEGLAVAPERIGPDGRVRVEATLVETAGRAGEAVVFLFLRDVVALPNRPVLELRGFARVAVSAGGRASVAFDLDAAALASLDETRAPRLEPGRFEIRLGLDADPAGQLVADLVLTEPATV